MKKKIKQTRFFPLFCTIICFFSIALSSFISSATIQSSNIYPTEGTKAVCEIGEQKFTSIGKAIEVAESGQVIYVFPGNTDQNDTSYEIRPTDSSINYLTIKSGVRLCVPYGKDSEGNYIESTYKSTTYGNRHGLGPSPTKPKSIVTLKDGITLINNGTIDIGGEIIAGSGNNPSGGTTENYSALYLGNKSVIQNIGTINSYGFIGEKSANNGSQIICQNTYSYFTADHEQITIFGNSVLNLPFYWYDYGGGSALKAIYDNINTKKCMPLDDFYFENITVETVFNAGVTVNGWVNLYAANYNGSYVLSLISQNATSIITLSNENSVIKCKYNDKTLVMKMDFYGSAAFNKLEIDVKQAIIDTAGSAAWALASIAGIPSSVSSDSGYFPISFHYDISLNPFPNNNPATFDGSNNRYKLMNGGNFAINENATFKAKEVVVYDGWDYYTGRATNANASKTILNIRSDIKNMEPLFLIKGSLQCSESAVGTLVVQNSGIISSQNNILTMYEPKNGTATTVSKTMTEWYAKKFGQNILTQDTRTSRINCISAKSTNGYATAQYSKGTFSLTTSLSPTSYQNPATITYKWIVDNANATFTNALGSTTEVTIPAVKKYTKSVTYTIYCTLTIKYDDESSSRTYYSEVLTFTATGR